MSREDIICMALEAGMKASIGKTDKDGLYHPFINALGKDVPIEWLERFFELAAAAERAGGARHFQVAMRNALMAEREACARIAETSPDRYHAAAAIRARGQA